MYIIPTVNVYDLFGVVSCPCRELGIADKRVCVHKRSILGTNNKKYLCLEFAHKTKLHLRKKTSRVCSPGALDDAKRMGELSSFCDSIRQKITARKASSKTDSSTLWVSVDVPRNLLQIVPAHRCMVFEDKNGQGSNDKVKLIVSIPMETQAAARMQATIGAIREAVAQVCKLDLEKTHTLQVDGNEYHLSTVHCAGTKKTDVEYKMQISCQADITDAVKNEMQARRRNGTQKRKFSGTGQCDCPAY